MNEYIRFIIKTVDSSPGITGIDLSMTVMNQVNPVRWDAEEYLASLHHCIKENRIEAFSFKLPCIENLKSVYFIKGTRVIS